MVTKLKLIDFCNVVSVLSDSGDMVCIVTGFSFRSTVTKPSSTSRLNLHCLQQAISKTNLSDNSNKGGEESSKEEERASKQRGYKQETKEGIWRQPAGLKSMSLT